MGQSNSRLEELKRQNIIPRCKSIDDLPPLPPCSESPVKTFNELINHDPAFGHQYGFSKTGIRLDIEVQDSLEYKRGWDIHELVKLVDVITWANVKDDQWVQDKYKHGLDWDQEKARSLINLTGFANMAYVALYANDAKIRTTINSALIKWDVISSIEDENYGTSSVRKDGYSLFVLLASMSLVFGLLVLGLN